MSMIEQFCRICYEEEIENNKFISPCRCSGTSKYIHENCLKLWRSRCENPLALTQCMECNTPYTIIKKYKKEKFEIIIFDVNYPGNQVIQIFCFENLSIALISLIFFLHRGRFINNFFNNRNFKKLFNIQSGCYYLFTFSFLSLIVHQFVNIYFLYKIYYKVFRIRAYLKLNGAALISAIIFQLHFLWLYAFICLTADIDPTTIETYIYIEFIFAIFNYFINIMMYNLHNKTIIMLNDDMNADKILNFREENTV